MIVVSDTVPATHVRYHSIVDNATSHRRTPRRTPMKRLRVPIALITLMVACTSARSADTTLSFDDIVPGAAGALTAQYAGRGVTFEQGIVIGSPTARSGANVAVGV